MTPVDPHKTLEPGNIEQSLEQYLPNINKIADISIEIPFNLDTSDIGPAKKYSGFYDQPITPWIIRYEFICIRKEGS